MVFGYFGGRRRFLRLERKDRTRIAVNNDVYLDNTSRIKVFGALSNNPAARITVPDSDYYVGRKVLDDTSATINQNYKKFEVTPKGGSEQWEVDSDGKLKQK